MIITQSNDVIQNITKSITENNISELNLEKGKQYLITWDKTTFGLSLEQDINKVIYIKKIMFFNISQVKEDLLDNTLFERLISDDDININSEFFDMWQKTEIMLGKSNSINYSIYAKQKFNHSQMEEIRFGLEKGLDISMYIDQGYDAGQMREIRFGLEEGLDVSIYAKQEFRWQQMETLRKGLENNLDISLVAKPEFIPEQMKQILIALELGKNVNKILSPEIEAGFMCDIYLERTHILKARGFDTDIIFSKTISDDTIKNYIINKIKNT